MNKFKDFWKYTVSEQRVYTAQILVGLIGVAVGSGIRWSSDVVPLAVSIGLGLLTCLALVAYPLHQVFFYKVELEVRMIANDHDAANKMAIQIREKAKAFGLKIAHECYPDPVDLPTGAGFLSPSGKVHPVHLVVNGVHWRMRKFAGQLDDTIKAVSGMDVQIAGISNMLNNPFPGADSTES